MKKAKARKTSPLVRAGPNEGSKLQLEIAGCLAQQIKPQNVETRN